MAMQRTMEDLNLIQPTKSTALTKGQLKHITDLPDELLLDIFERAVEAPLFWQYKPSVPDKTASSLVKVCRLFARIALETAYRDAVIQENDDLDDDETIKIWKDDFLNGPYAARLCQKLTIKSPSVSSTSLNVHRTSQRLSEILIRLPTLHCLDIRAGTADPQPDGHTSTNLPTTFTRFVMVNTLILSTVRSATSFFQLIVHGLPNLRRLMVTDLLTIHDAECLTYLQRTSKIEELHLGSTHGNEDSFRLFLGWIKALKKFSIRNLMLYNDAGPGQVPLYKAISHYHKTSLRFFAPSWINSTYFEWVLRRDLCDFTDLEVLYLHEDRVLDFGRRGGPGSYCIVGPKLRRVIIAESPQLLGLRQPENASTIASFMDFTFQRAVSERSVTHEVDMLALQGFSNDFHSRSADPLSPLWSYNILCGSFSAAMA